MGKKDKRSKMDLGVSSFCFCPLITWERVERLEMADFSIFSCIIRGFVLDNPFLFSGIKNSVHAIKSFLLFLSADRLKLKGNQKLLEKPFKRWFYLFIPFVCVICIISAVYEKTGSSKIWNDVDTLLICQRILVVFYESGQCWVVER